MKRRKLNIQSTLNAYENRLKNLPDAEFEVLKDKFLSSFDIYDTFYPSHFLEQFEHRFGTHLDAPIWRLMRVCIEKNIIISGLTSERVLHGNRIAALPEGAKTIYVGPHNSFLNKKRIIFSLHPVDKRYES